MQAFFIRHAQSNYNVLGLCNDDPKDDVHLTPGGIKQAEIAAETLRDTPLDMIVTSELPRTQQTAEIINRYHSLPIRSNPVLNDILTGFNGKTVDEYFSATAADPLRIAAKGGESLLEHKRRLLSYLDWLQQQPFRCVLSVVHEEGLRVFYAWHHGIQDENLRDLHFANCEVIQFTLGE